MAAPDFALAHAAQRTQLANMVAAAGWRLWSKVDRGDIQQSWLTLLADLIAILTGAQKTAAAAAEPFTAAASGGAAAEGVVAAASFAGMASDGRNLVSLLSQPVFTALGAIKSGATVDEAMMLGGAQLQLINRTQVTDAGRTADQVALIARPQMDGYVRVIVGDTCSRCIILAGRWYPYTEFFERHPNCDCIMVPANDAAGLVQDPLEIYNGLTPQERTAAGWSAADQKAVNLGADIVQVTNVHRRDRQGRGGVYTAGGRQYTHEGTTRRGIYGGYDIDPETGKMTRRPRGSRRKGPRATPEQIFEDAGGDRDEAIRLLRQNGYLLGKPSTQDDVQAPSAADPSVDPALKMKVADLKKIAKDNGVRLQGWTKRADIVWVLRNHEMVHKVKLAGLPEWKPPKVERPREPEIAAPRLDKPNMQGKALSGDMLNNWSDYLVYDLQYSRHKWVDAAGNTPPEGVRVQNLRTSIQGSGAYYVAHGTAWRFDGVAYLIEHGPNEHGATWVSRTLEQLRNAHAEIPAAARANESYTAVNGENPADPYWRKEYNNPDHVSGMTAGGGHITIWLHKYFSNVDVESLRHETGHNLDDLAGRKIGGSQSPAWTSAAESDAKSSARIADLTSRWNYKLAVVEPGRGYPNGVTEYGRSSPAEDFAESVMLYQLGPIAKGRLTPGDAVGELYFRDIYPARAKILDEIFPDIAEVQKAEIKELRSPQKPPTTPKPEKPVKPVKAVKKAAAKKAVKPEKKPVPDLSKMTVVALKALAKERGLKGYSKLLKAQLLELLS
jgi:hypothetical protein